jgi:CheY-like chemotaxis protein
VSQQPSVVLFQRGGAAHLPGQLGLPATRPRLDHAAWLTVSPPGTRRGIAALVCTLAYSCTPPSPAKAGRLRRVQRSTLPTSLSDLLRGRHIVAADEKPELLQLIVNTLREDGHCVFQAYDGLAAFQLAIALGKIDLLITDTRMPGLDGPALIHQVRERLPSLPVLYVANEGNTAAGIERQLPADIPVLREPFTAKELRAAVSSLLSPED